jgi:hypothetical protein
MDSQLSLFHSGHHVVPAIKLKMLPYDTIGGTPLQTSDLSASAMRAFSDELDSAFSCDKFSATPGSVATMTTQGFDKHGIERDFYSLMPLHGESLKEQSCDTRLCDPSCDSTLRISAQDHGEDLMSDARSHLISTSEVWLLNENTKSPFGVATFLEVTSGSSLPSSSTVLRVKTMILFCTDPRILTRATSGNVSVLPRDLCHGENMSLYVDVCPLAVQGHGEMIRDQRQSSRIDITGQVSASALGTKFPLTLSADAHGGGSKPKGALLCNKIDQAPNAMSLRVCFMLNKTFTESIKSTPLRQAHGTDKDVSPMLCFLFYTPVCYLVDETTFPSESKELCGRWVGTSENVGHFMTYKILTDDTRRITHRSNVRLAADSYTRNLRLDPPNDEPPEVIRSLHKSSPALDHGEDFSLHSTEPTSESPSATPASEHPSNEGDATIVDPQELMGHAFLMDTQEDGQSFCASIVECISEHESNVRRSDDHVKFRTSANEDEYEEIITYNELMESSGNAARPFPVVPNRAGCFKDATIKDDDEDTSRLFADLAEFVLDLQSNFECSVTEVLANDRFIASPDSASPFC